MNNINNQARVDNFFSDILNIEEIVNKYAGENRKYLSADFNVFNYIWPDENKLSDIITDLLNPFGRHGQGSAFLQAFISILKEKININDQVYNTKKIKKIERESRTLYIDNNLRRMDILIKWEDAVIMIENKPWAIDQENQIGDYNNNLEYKYKNYIIVYLSNHPPSDKDKYNELFNKNKIIIFYYNEDFIDWINQCISQSYSDKIRWFLRDFVKYVELNI